MPMRATLVVSLVLCCSLGVAQTKPRTGAQNKLRKPAPAAAAETIEFGPDAFKPKKDDVLALAEELKSATAEERAGANYARKHARLLSLAAGVKDQLTDSDRELLAKVEKPGEESVKAFRAEEQQVQRQAAERAAAAQNQGPRYITNPGPSAPAKPTPLPFWMSNKVYTGQGGEPRDLNR